MAEQARALGLPAEMAARLAARAQASAQPEAIGIWPENWQAVRTFLGMETQWRRAGLRGMPTGLDYGVLPVVAGALGIAVDAELLARLRVLEGAALAAMLESRSR